MNLRAALETRRIVRVEEQKKKFLVGPFRPLSFQTQHSEKNILRQNLLHVVRRRESRLCRTMPGMAIALEGWFVL
jgi:arginine repressor